jgi:hypothetical protein
VDTGGTVVALGQGQGRALEVGHEGGGRPRNQAEGHAPGQSQGLGHLISTGQSRNLNLWNVLRNQRVGLHHLLLQMDQMEARAGHTPGANPKKVKHCNFCDVRVFGLIHISYPISCLEGGVVILSSCRKM